MLRSRHNTDVYTLRRDSLALFLQFMTIFVCSLSSPYELWPPTVNSEIFLENSIFLRIVLKDTFATFKICD